MADTPVDTDHTERKITIKDVQIGLAYLQKQLHRDEALTAGQAATYFTKIHTHAAWTGLDALANLAERIWSDLDILADDHALSANERAGIGRMLVTYKFLLHRVSESLGPAPDDSDPDALAEAS